MKKIFAIALLMASTAAFAQTSTVGGNQSTNCPAGATTCAGSTSNSGSQATNQGNNQNITVNIPAAEQKDLTRTIIDQNVSGTQTIKNVPSVSGSPLTSSNDTCMGSTSGSVNVPGFGASVGSTWADENCKMLKNSRELWNMGMKAAALALMCTDVNNREALEMTGFICPQTLASKKQEAASPQYTDPIIRQRLGLSPLK